VTAITIAVVALGVLSGLAALNSLVFGLRYVRYARQASEARGQASGAELASVTLIAPCCGAEDGLEGNLEALVLQDYPHLQVRFVVETAEDGATPVIERLRERHPARVERIIAGPSHDHGQKVHNLLAALDAGPLADVLVFADSDGRPEPGWLRRLVAELDDPGVGVASSYRFYRPVPATFSTLLRSVWNLSVLALLGDHDRNFAWGGSMAIRREVFGQANVREAWRGALSDDYAMTHAVRRAGLRVAFVPACLVESEGSVGFASMLTWVARQISITRVYWPTLFWLAAVSNLSSTAFLVVAPIVGGVVPLSLLAAVLVLGCASGGLRAVALGHLAPQWRVEVHRWLWAYVLMAPLCGLVTTYAVLSALVSRQIEWRGIRYEMRSPNETVVLERSKSI
jgi:cellulose synthase/poly-beta-1,6-N-acetylglucosamine synthase-like glycosyltransferase